MTLSEKAPPPSSNKLVFHLLKFLLNSLGGLPYIILILEISLRDQNIHKL